MKSKISLSVPKLVCIGLFMNGSLLAGTVEQVVEEELQPELPGELIQQPEQGMEQERPEDVVQRPGQVEQERPEEVVQQPVGKPIMQEDSVLKFLRDHGDFHVLTEVLEASGLLATLEEEGPWTIFAPADRAFDALGEQQIEQLKEDQDALRKLLLYHVVAGEIDLSRALQEQSTETVSGDMLSFSADGYEAYVNEALIVEANIRTANGIVHIVDQVLMPMGAPVPEPSGTILELGKANPDFSILIDLVMTAELDAVFEQQGPFTVFAPTNAAFEALGVKALEALKQDMDLLRDILFYHVIVGEDLRSDQVIQLSAVEMANGQDIMIQVGEETLMINSANIIQADIAADNGVIHVIDTVLLP